jgi:hypothetical protein
MAHIESVSDTLMNILSQAGINSSSIKVRGEVDYSRFVSYCDALVREGCLTQSKRNELVVAGLRRISSAGAVKGSA